jgi:hypothetical protein
MTTTNPSTQAHPLESLTVDQLRRYPLADSGLIRRGFDKTEVEELLQAVAEYIGQLRKQRDAAVRKVRYREYEIQHRRHGVGLPAAGEFGELLHEEQLEWHLRAQRYGDEITMIAQEQAGRIVEDAMTQAERIRTAIGDAPPCVAEDRAARAARLRQALGDVGELLDEMVRQVEVARDLAHGLGARPNPPGRAGPVNGGRPAGLTESG